jgi:hypothetical protein
MNWFKSINTQQYIQLYLSHTVEFSKIVLGSLLSVFVPQLCDGQSHPIIEDPVLSNTTLVSTSYACTMNDNFQNLITFNEFVLAINFITLLCFTYNLILESRRERFIIDNFDYEKNKSSNAIQQVFQEKSDLRITYLKLTNKLYYMNFVCIIFMFLNILFSAILVFYYYYDGYKTATGLLTNIMLMIQKVFKNKNILLESRDKTRVLSTMLMAPYHYNMLDVSKYGDGDAAADAAAAAAAVTTRISAV